MFDSLKVDTNYIKSKAVFEDGDWWYYSPSGYRQRVSTHAAKNKNRMFVNGKYIPSSHPLHKPGRYKSLDDAWSHNKIESIDQGEVYIIINTAWPDWVKIGCAVDAQNRFKDYHTYSPMRDYQLVHTISTPDREKAERVAHKAAAMCGERQGEWFKIPSEEAVTILQHIKETEDEQKRESTN